MWLLRVTAPWSIWPALNKFIQCNKGEPVNAFPFAIFTACFSNIKKFI